jgi:colanic acid/amylovoran biosynthesis glycosyltransferase
MDKPVVAHFVRGFLRPTETFIGNQIVTLQRYEPVVFCHHLIRGHSFPSIEATTVAEILSPVQQTLQKSYYRVFRGMTPFAANHLADAVKQSKARILHFHYLVEARFFLSVLQRLKLPSVVSGYGWDVSRFPRSKFGYGNYYLRPIFREMDLFLAMSDDMKRDFMKLGCPESKIVVHYFGNEVKRFAFPDRQYVGDKTLRLLFCGRLTAKKAPQLVLKVLKLLEETRIDTPEWKLVFVGDGPLRAELEDTVNYFGWKHKVEFVGHVPYHSAQFVDVYKNADVYILPSVTANNEKEGIPGSLIEAMASGLPCISSYHAGIPSIITTGKDGFLTQEGHVGAIADVLSSLLRDSVIRERIGKAAAKIALHNFDLLEKTKELEIIYDGLLNERVYNSIQRDNPSTIALEGQ